MTRVSGESIAMGELSGYKISYGRDPEALDEEVTIDEASTTSHTIENLSQGKWYFAVQAVDTEGLESPLSTVVTKSI
ncbi:fibronectin type III domain-containing protein [Marinobacter nanhaiticus D15-8W]|uniref:Fibronectin type III domain-containing protein n=2 Tax=Marinobacter TaxID=2742 RepID=A0A371CG98_9GAMM|nr:fibronectin type III domain-containing protein [Marinobacter nanhaiticus D15-8W]